MRVYGDAGSTARLENDVYKLVRELSPERAKALPFLYLNCGTEDFLIDDSRDFLRAADGEGRSRASSRLPVSTKLRDRQVQEVLRLAAHQLSAPADGAKAKSNAAGGSLKVHAVT